MKEIIKKMASLVKSHKNEIASNDEVRIFIKDGAIYAQSRGYAESDASLLEGDEKHPMGLIILTGEESELCIRCADTSYGWERTGISVCDIDEEILVYIQSVSPFDFLKEGTSDCYCGDDEFNSLVEEMAKQSPKYPAYLDSLGQ